MFVWAGDELLWELKSASGTHPGAAGGNVQYFHAGGIDRPVVIRKEGHPTIIPHQNWRGQFARGTYTSGAVSDCTGQTTSCTNINWPGYRTTAWHQMSGDGPDIRTWFGGLVDGMRDASGQMYMRNRYYDPGTGQFTQTDPIGLGGGLNAYGFAAGDPVSYSDPYGLKVCYQGSAQQRSDLVKATEQATNTTITLDKQNCIKTATANKEGQNAFFRGPCQQVGRAR